jgi:hypothetical protein
VTGPLLKRGGDWLIAIRVTPKASVNDITGFHSAADGTMSLAVKVTAVADKGKANKAVIDLLAKQLGFPRSSFEILRGETERNKLLRFAGDAERLAAKITALVKSR